MSVNIKISQTNLELVEELQNELKKEDIKISQRNLVHYAIRFSFLEREGVFLKSLRS